MTIARLMRCQQLLQYLSARCRGPCNTPHLSAVRCTCNNAMQCTAHAQFEKIPPISWSEERSLTVTALRNLPPAAAAPHSTPADNDMLAQLESSRPHTAAHMHSTVHVCSAALHSISTQQQQQQQLPVCIQTVTHIQHMIAAACTPNASHTFFHRAPAVQRHNTAAAAGMTPLLTGVAQNSNLTDPAYQIRLRLDFKHLPKRSTIAATHHLQSCSSCSSCCCRHLAAYLLVPPKRHEQCSQSPPGRATQTQPMPVDSCACRPLSTIRKYVVHVRHATTPRPTEDTDAAALPLLLL
jgi:hypothetical protein